MLYLRSDMATHSLVDDDDAGELLVMVTGVLTNSLPIWSARTSSSVSPACQ